MESSRQPKAPWPVYLALAVPANSAIGIASGVRIIELESRGVIAHSETIMTHWDGDAADLEVSLLGFVRTHPWHDSGGQWAARVEPVAGFRSP
ncbi:hypothetical protein [Microlunatus parietis]|uniref:Uncharacterized protein n=1 Tax=Microlunatus parietis TaxID=682979 RepID=A0A7Y9I412_9ACTN|nr:hypothetical protein [Microlunatus parietis]NYE69834.1 hypothetical protein [Microlunatus parietis]